MLLVGAWYRIFRVGRVDRKARQFALDSGETPEGRRQRYEDDGEAEMWMQLTKKKRTWVVFGRRWPRTWMSKFWRSAHAEGTLLQWMHKKARREEGTAKD